MKKSIYSRPNKPMFSERRSKPMGLVEPIVLEPLVEVYKSTQCFVTPFTVAEMMISCFSSLNGAFLEPSAGTGNLVDAMLAKSIDDITVVEKDSSMARSLRERYDFITITEGCFLEYSKSNSTRFDRILMNPPFLGVARHIRSAVSLLKKNGEIVAVVPRTFSQAGFELVADLDSGTFQGTSVTTKVVHFSKL